VISQTQARLAAWLAWSCWPWLRGSCRSWRLGDKQDCAWRAARSSWLAGAEYPGPVVPPDLVSCAVAPSACGGLAGI